MTVIEEAKEAMLSMEINELIDKNAAENLIAYIDQMYLKDESAQAYEAYEEFMRPYNDYSRLRH